MYIKSVQIVRFKQFSKTKIDLQEGLTLVVGGNNSGKSSVLQALATWQFCKTILEIEKGRKAWAASSGIQGVGMGIVDFTPMNVPSLAHLWTNLKTHKIDEADGYTLKIKVTWLVTDGTERHLEVGMSLVNDRLFVKNTDTNLTLAEVQDAKGNPIDANVPSIAYLPPFAGMTDRETRLTPAMRGRLIGQGLSGGILRNILYELHETNRTARTKLRGERTKIKNSDLATLRQTDSWEILQKTLQGIFGTELRMGPFNERYHSYLNVECIKGAFNENEVFVKHPSYSPRDIMVEGSGFLQWLSVYALALSPDLNIILLDEPDAHLHPSLQQELVQALERIGKDKNKQILLATHSSELIRSYEHNHILAIRGGRGKYLNSEEGKISALAGIGTIHTPTMHSLIKHKRMLIVEGVSDERFLKIFAERAGISWPENLVVWVWTGKHAERFQLFTQLRKEIPDLVAVSIRDRDEDSVADVLPDLTDKGFTPKPGFTAMKWRRRHIENYLLCLTAIGRAANTDSAQFNEFFIENHALALPSDTTPSVVPDAILDARGKQLIREGADSIKEKFGIDRDDIAKALLKTEVAEDMRIFLNRLSTIFPLIQTHPIKKHVKTKQSKNAGSPSSQSM